MYLLIQFVATLIILFVAWAVLSWPAAIVVTVLLFVAMLASAWGQGEIYRGEGVE